MYGRLGYYYLLMSQSHFETEHSASAMRRSADPAIDGGSFSRSLLILAAYVAIGMAMAVLVWSTWAR